MLRDKLEGNKKKQPGNAAFRGSQQNAEKIKIRYLSLLQDLSSKLEYKVDCHLNVIQASCKARVYFEKNGKKPIEMVSE